MARSSKWDSQEVQQRCDYLTAEWKDLENACEKRSAHLNKAVVREQVKAAVLSIIINVSLQILICTL